MTAPARCSHGCLPNTCLACAHAAGVPPVTAPLEQHRQAFRRAEFDIDAGPHERLECARGLVGALEAEVERLRGGILAALDNLENGPEGALTAEGALRLALAGN